MTISTVNTNKHLYLSKQCKIATTMFSQCSTFRQYSVLLCGKMDLTNLNLLFQRIGNTALKDDYEIFDSVAGNVY